MTAPTAPRPPRAAAPTAAGVSSASNGEAPIAPREFDLVAKRAYEVAGIVLARGKEQLVAARLAKRMRETGDATVAAYLARLEGPDGKAELRRMIDLLTTNKTNFFREPAHFDYLERVVLPGFTAGHPIRIWCAGCSTGEEPYTLGMVLAETLPQLDRLDLRILATDISDRVLAQAQAALYAESAVAEIDPALRRKYLQPVAGVGPNGESRYQVVERLRHLVTFGRVNLMEGWPMKGPFDVILCRNVMIYFDKVTQQRLVERFAQLLRPGGHLLVGHSESLSGLASSLTYVQPATYRKP